MPVKIIRYGQVESTNVIAQELGRAGEEAATVILADQQTAGSGRRGRQFFSPPGGLYMSVILRPALAPDRLPLVTLAAGVACALALEKLTGLRIRLKWPNDLYIGEKKLGGILAEAAPYSPSRRDIPFVVVGIGINVNTRPESFPLELRDHLISLYDVRCCSHDIKGLAESIAVQLCRTVDAVGNDMAAVLNSWRQRDFLLGRRIEWRDPQGRVWRGVGAGLMDDGCYRIRTGNNEQHAVLAGDLIISDGRE